MPDLVLAILFALKNDISAAIDVGLAAALTVTMCVDVILVFVDMAAHFSARKMICDEVVLAVLVCYFKSMLTGYSFLFLCGSHLFSAMLASEYGDQSWSKKCRSSPCSISSSSSLHFLSSTWFHCMANPLTSLDFV